MLTLELPYPPSVNHYWRNFKGRVLISREGRDYREAVRWALLAQRVVRQVGRLAVEVDVYPPDNRRRDLDNTQKGLLDSLAHGGAYSDDSQIDQLVLTRCEVTRGGRVVVRIKPWKIRQNMLDIADAQGRISEPEREVVTLPTGSTPQGCKGAVGMSDQSTLPALPQQEGVEFRHIPCLPGYCAGSDGSIWSCASRVPSHHPWRSGSKSVFKLPWRKKALSKNPRTGHLFIYTRKKNWYVHRLVLEAFVGPRPRLDMECCHFPDRNPENNRPENLRWDTKGANRQDSVIHGTSPRGEKNPSSKLTEPIVLEVRKYQGSGMAVKQVGAIFGISGATVSRVWNRKVWGWLKDE